MKGIIVFYINFFPELNQDIETTLNLVKNQNASLIEKMRESDYDIMFVPTVKEASRVEKVDFDKPFPRFVAPHVEVKDEEEDAL